MFKGVAWEQISGLVQRGLMFGAGVAVAKGWVNETNATQIVGGMVAFLGVLWSVKVNTAGALVASVEGLPQVKGVVTAPTAEGRALANSFETPTVAAAGTNDAKAIATGATP